MQLQEQPLRQGNAWQCNASAKRQNRLIACIMTERYFAAASAAHTRVNANSMSTSNMLEFAAAQYS
jgi:hypothetical protein